MKIEVRKSRKSTRERFYSVIIAPNGEITYKSEMVVRRQSALKTANNHARYINERKISAVVVDSARTYRK